MSDSSLVLVSAFTAASLLDRGSPEHASEADLQPSIKALMTEFRDVFAEPYGMPPDRGTSHVHPIPPAPNSESPFGRMYRLSPA